MSTLTIRLTCDGAPAQAFLAELETALQALEPELRQRFLDLVDGPARLLCIDGADLPAPGTGEVALCLRPSDRGLRFLAAVRAGDVDVQ